jgi:hypothetical protein
MRVLKFPYITDFACLDPRSFRCFAQCFHVIQNTELVACTQHKIHTWNLSDFARLELCITPCDYNSDIGISAHCVPHRFSALAIRKVGHRAGIQDKDIGRPILRYDVISTCPELLRQA